MRVEVSSIEGIPMKHKSLALALGVLLCLGIGGCSDTGIGAGGAVVGHEIGKSSNNGDDR